jgi:hypothetical protein
MQPIEKLTVGQRSVIIAEALVLIALALGLVFLFKTTGATLFLFATIAPLLEIVAVLIVAISLWTKYRQRVSWFDGERYQPGAANPAPGRSNDLDAVQCRYGVLVGHIDKTMPGSANCDGETNGTRDAA